MLCQCSSEFPVISVATFIALLIATSCCSAAETTVIATGLDRPTAVAVVGEQVFYADATGLHSLDDTPLALPDTAIHSLASLGGERLIVSSDEVRLWSLTGSLTDDSPQLELKQLVRVTQKTDSGPFTKLTIDESHAFALREGKTYRSRRAGKSLASLRTFGDSWANGIVAMALSERGYLVLLQAEGNDWRLVFCDPFSPEKEPIVSWGTPLIEPLALVYSPLPSPTERQLYALTTDGLYRLDAAVGETITATRIADIPQPVAMAFAPDGTLYVAALTEDGAGVLLRLDTPL